MRACPDRRHTTRRRQDHPGRHLIQSGNEGRLRMLRRFSSASMSANDGSRVAAYHA